MRVVLLQGHGLRLAPDSSFMADLVDGGDVATIISRLEDQVTAYIQSAACPGTLQLHRLRDAFVASIGHGLLLSGHTSTKRDIYYMNKALFGRQSNADAAVERVAAAVPCHRNNLNIVAASKALVAGDLTYVTEQGFEIKVHMFGHSGVLVPPRPERLTQIGTDAEFVLVVEKETVFTSLGSHPGFLEASKCILLTGKGYPDYAARLLLESIAKSYPALPILVLTDADPHGLHIALTYHAALPANAAFHFIGVRPSDRDGVLSNLTDEVLLPLKPVETVLAQNLVATTTFPQAAGATSALQDIVTELQYCLDSCAKFEIEALITLDNSYCTLIEYLKLRVGDILTNSSIASL